MRRLAEEKLRSPPPPGGRVGKTTGSRAKRRVLIVEDHEDTRAMYAAYLRHAGWEVEAVANGVEALHVVSTFAPHVIVMDLEMPELDGVEATRRLKHDPALRAIRVVVLTAHPSYDHAAFRAGCDDFLVKPCAPSALEKALATVTASRE